MTGHLSRTADAMAHRRFLPVDGYRGLGTWFVLVLIFLYTPIVVLIVYSFNSNSLIGAWQSFSLHWYRITFHDPAVLQAIGNTLIVAVCATAIATLVAIYAAIGIVRGGGALGRFSQALLVLPLAVPEIVLAIATLLLFSTLQIHAGLINLIVAHAVFCTPFALLPIRATLLEIDVALEHAARDLYCTPLQCFRRVTLPMLLPGILAGTMLSLVLSIDDFVTSYMLANAGNTTVPVYIFAMIRQGVTPQINALSSLLLTVSLLLVGGFWFAYGRKLET